MVKNYQELLGKTFKLDAEGFLIDVMVKDIKNSYGVLRARVSPVYGDGDHWVALSRLEGAN